MRFLGAENENKIRSASNYHEQIEQLSQLEL